MIHIRRAGAMDAVHMAELLNEIIDIGGTTAHTGSVSAKDLADWIARDAATSAWFVAEDDQGKLLGFQWIEPMHTGDACSIATFVRVGTTGLGIGSRLFEKTRAAARLLGYTWINAAIRTDNAGGIAYYQSRGFELYGRRDNVVLDDGMTVSQELRRYDL